ncbi:FAD-binding oxidoreductase [Arthrobacter crusticola]|uniref:FAD-binding oxidoreductase n=1 Tax=Arthrobacter crusticola TaxID=2547960 RepID=A0A4R5U2Z9_9MICC|nr:FAD-binding oxidoreductase [Arthrobacter crusticola]TDK27968.1 FAD-binding oxidoreductase [Arthrobacter crusticola]
MAEVSVHQLNELRTLISGPVLARGDDALAAEVAAYNVLVKHDPDLVVGADSEADVAAAVRFATENSLPLTVFATGHGSYVDVTEGLMLTTSRLAGEVAVDADARTATVAAGHRVSDVVAAAATHGLAPVVGSSTGVGAIGYILGGGVGPLARTFGMSSDWVRAFRVITAEGDLVHADATHSPDLFWALRGGKGGLGVVTAMELELVPLKTLYGGSMFFAPEHVGAVFTAWLEWTQTVPEELTSSAAIVRFPPLEFIPEPLRGKTALHLRVAYVGAASEGQRLLAPLRGVAPALIDAVSDMAAADIGSIHNDPDDPIPLWDGNVQRLLTHADAGFAAALLGAVGPDVDVPVVAAEVRHLGGATRRDVPEGSAVGGRSSDYSLLLAGLPDPSLFESVLPQAMEGITSRLAPWLSDTTLINFQAKPADEAAVSSWPADIRARLAEVGAAYDPRGIFSRHVAAGGSGEM